MSAVDLRPVKRALLSVSDKTGLVAFAEGLAKHGVELLSTGGTADALRKAGLAVKDVSEHTGFPEMLDGRVKTLHPKIHGGLLGKRDDAAHRDAMDAHGITDIDLVVVNLYPFEQTVAKYAGGAKGGQQADPALSGASLRNQQISQEAYEDCVENIDIGGPAMVRSAAKNHADVAIITDVADYAQVLEILAENGGATTFALRKWLAGKAYARTAAYDAAIAQWFAQQAGESFPEQLIVTAKLKQVLRYGENPHQSAAWYVWSGAEEGLAAAEQVQGKELSYNNLNDTDAAYQLVQEFSEPAVAIIKHANPCGVAVAATQVDAFSRALACDPQSAFGGIIALNRPLDAATVEVMGGLFVEVIIAPGASDEAKALLEKKKNLRLLVIRDLAPTTPRWTLKPIAGGVLVQDEDRATLVEADLKTVSKRAPSQQEEQDMRIAFAVAKHVKSNAIVLVKDGATVGIGAGQMSRVDSVRIATLKAKEAGLSVVGAALASDAFFPFADNIHLAAEHGISALIQPGGSIRDEEVFAAADQYGMAMVTTGIRHFRH
ncbi:MAG: bifunctional phosphoribosylaminoimidazolecarboxamide formyltransferase/IMP cyclohydrolase [Alphaproteobacteria bacterium]|nr:bifunctional phosphoribosylaminoimidazolecarboxamide formyltransferase/IMP cyclohydrolase [Alphaproteobacteria bacterium]